MNSVKLIFVIVPDSSVPLTLLHLAMFRSQLTARLAVHLQRRLELQGAAGHGLVLGPHTRLPPGQRLAAARAQDPLHAVVPRTRRDHRGLVRLGLGAAVDRRQVADLEVRNAALAGLHAQPLEGCGLRDPGPRSHVAQCGGEAGVAVQQVVVVLQLDPGPGHHAVHLVGTLDTVLVTRGQPARNIIKQALAL